MFFQLGTVIRVWSHSPLKPDFCWEVPIEKRWSVYILKTTALQTTSWIIPFCYTHDYGRDIPGSRRQPAQNFWLLKNSMHVAGGFLLPEHGKSRCLAWASKGRVGQGSRIKRRYYCLWEHISPGSAPHIGENARLFMNSYCELPDNSQFPRLPFIVSSAGFKLFVRSKGIVVVCPTRVIDSATSWCYEQRSKNQPSDTILGGTR